MAFRYRLDESFATGTRRIALEQVDRARRQLTREADAGVAVHETRKCFKRIRALIRLARPSLKQSQYRNLNDRFRDLGRLLAQSRDLDVMVQTLTYLESRHSSLSKDDSTERAREAIARAQKKAVADVAEPPIEVALKELKKARSVIAKLDLARCALDRLSEGFSREMHGFAKRYEDTLQNPNDETFHEWRKRTQYHRRHVSLLTTAWPDALEARLKVCHQLSEYLGLDHDLAVLSEFVSNRNRWRMAKGKAERIQKLCSSEQSELRGNAVALGALLVAESPDALRRRIEAYWTVRTQHPIDLKIAAE